MQAGYGHENRGYATFKDPAPRVDHWSKTSYAPPDHLCRPVIVDADGRKHPIVSFTPIATPPQVHSPFADVHRHAPHTSVEPPSHVEGRPQYRSSQDHGRFHKVEEFLTKVQTEATTPKRFGLLSHPAWRRTHNSTGHHGHGHGNTGYGDYGGRKTRNQIGHEDRDSYNHRQEPHMVTSGGWARPSHSGWAAPLYTSLTAPTNDVGTAVDYLKDASRPITGRSSFYTDHGRDRVWPNDRQ